MLDSVSLYKAESIKPTDKLILVVLATLTLGIITAGIGLSPDRIAKWGVLVAAAIGIGSLLVQDVSDAVLRVKRGIVTFFLAGAPVMALYLTESPSLWKALLVTALSAGIAVGVVSLHHHASE